MRLALIAPRYGREIAGGAERLARGFAKEALRRGWLVEVWTTCASGHYTWANTLPPGPAIEDGIRVIRFPVTAYDRGRRMALESRIGTQGMLTGDDQYAWLETGPHSAGLYAHVSQHAAEFDAVIALPFANPLVHYAAWIAPEKILLWPCLHDEPYAYMEPVRLLLESVWAVAFNTPEEARIVTNQLQITITRSAVLGVGVSMPGIEQGSVTNDLISERDNPYLVYVGRLEAGKNLSQLYDYVRRYREEEHRFRQSRRLRLIVVGDGSLTPPRQLAFDYRGFVADDDLVVIMAGALALCQPSWNESFSLTIMESWLTGRPVLVSGASAVTRAHVGRSKGGLWFDGYTDFAGAVSWLLANDDLASRMGVNGRQYVQANYTWPMVVDRFAQAFSEWQGQSQGAQPEGPA